MWQSIGPDHIPNGQTYGTNRVDVIGRVSSIAIDPGNAKHILLGSAGGGIWESKNSGTTWQPRTDKMPSLAIGALTFDPSNGKRVYAGSGEGNFYANLGAGIYRSTDGGTTWTVLASVAVRRRGLLRSGRRSADSIDALRRNNRRVLQIDQQRQHLESEARR